jgi:PadR family transcriptional regulator PadR
VPKEPRAAEFEQLVLLAILHSGENAYGISIHREIENRIERRTALGAVYTTLDRLEKKGYVSSWTGTPSLERGGRSKRFFKVQALGKVALRNSALIRAAMASGLRVRSEKRKTKRKDGLADFLAESTRPGSGLRTKRAKAKNRLIKR